MNLSFLPIATPGLSPASLVWFDWGEAFLILTGGVVFGALAILGASALARRRTPKIVWPPPRRVLNRKVLARG